MTEGQLGELHRPLDLTFFFLLERGRGEDTCHFPLMPLLKENKKQHKWGDSLHKVLVFEVVIGNGGKCG